MAAGSGLGLGRPGGLPHTWSCQDLVGHFAGYVGEAEIAAAVVVSELLVIEAQEVEDGRVEVVYMHAVSDRVIADFVGGSVDEAGFDAAAGHPDGVSVGIVVAAVLVL